MNDKSSTTKEFPRLLGFLVLILFLPYIMIYLFLHFLYGLVLQIAVWIYWIPRGKSILIITSESPIWQSYMEEHIISVLQPQAMVLNWSKRIEWAHSCDLKVLTFYYFGGKSEFNPLAVVFRPFRRAKVFRFWNAFKSYKHEKEHFLKNIKEELLEYAQVNQNQNA